MDEECHARSQHPVQCSSEFQGSPGATQEVMVDLSDDRLLWRMVVIFWCCAVVTSINSFPIVVCDLNPFCQLQQAVPVLRASNHARFFRTPLHEDPL